MTSTTTHLRTGWEPDTPAGDTYVRLYLLHMWESCAAIARLAGGDVTATDHWLGADTRRRGGYHNVAVVTSPPEDVPGVLDDIDDFLRPGRGTALVWSPWPLRGAGDRGWSLSGHPPLLVRPPADLVPVPPTDLAPERVLDAGRAVEWERTAIEAYPLDELRDEPPGALVPAGLLRDERFGFWLTRDDRGDPVAVGALFRDLGVASLMFGATRPAARGRGHWRTLAVERLNAAAGDWVLGVFSDSSRGPAEALGFVPIVRFHLWIVDRRELSPQAGTD